MRRSFASMTFAASAVAFWGPAAADTFHVGDLSAGGLSTPRSFDAALTGGFTDYYTFSLGSLSTLAGGAIETDGLLKSGAFLKIKDLEVGSLSLEKKTSGGAYGAVASDPTSDAFSFAALSAGEYRLTVKGTITSRLRYAPSESGNGGAPSYRLMATATSMAPTIAPVPELSDLTMTAMGLAGVALWARRRKA